MCNLKAPWKDGSGGSAREYVIPRTVLSLPRNWIWLLPAILCALQVMTAAATPQVDFISPENGQQIATFSTIAGTAQADTGSIQAVVFSIYNQSTSQWWDGT